ncbi:hypothetical protein [Acinetobacter pittii]|uniref:hypothetical protein n=1 Tax=Acinetobacter pittii TaxID=48296 RepID=UPI0030084243
MSKFEKLQNKVRGAIAERKSQKVFDGKSLNLSNEKLKRDIKQIFFLARSDLEFKDFRKFIIWVNQQIESQVKDYNQYTNKSYIDVAGLFTHMPEVSWERELSWVIERLISEAEKLNDFFQLLIKIENMAYHGDFKNIFDELENFEKLNGASLWSIQLKISFEQTFNGLAEQKKYANTFRKLYKTGLLSYIVFFISSRNEEKTNYLKFVEDFENSISKHKYYKERRELTNFLRYKILGQYPNEVNEIKDLLLIEQAHSIYDIYDTFINVIQNLILRNQTYFLEKFSKKFEQLDILDDYRIKKIISFLRNKSIINNSNREYKWYDYNDSSKIASERIFVENNLTDIWGIINNAYNLYHNEFYNGENLFEQTMNGFLNFTKFNKTSAIILNQYNKHVLNFDLLPTIKAISLIIKPLSDVKIDCKLEYSSFGLNSPTIGLEDKKINIDKLYKKNEINLFLKVIKLLNIKDYSSAYHILVDLVQSDNQFIRNYCKHNLLKLCFLQNDTIGILHVMSSMNLEFLNNYDSYIFKKIIKSIKYQDVKNIDNYLDRENLINVCLLHSDDSNLLASLRLGIKSVCNLYNVDKPSELTKLPMNAELINFLAEICVPNNLDMCRLKALKGSKLVIDERIEICNRLRSIDKINSDRYEHELSRLNYLKTLEEGKKVLSSSRIYVDVDAFKKWAIHEISDEISRYQDLAEIVPDQNVQYLELIQGIYSNENYLSNFIPESDADLLLLNILRRCEQAFLFNSNWGLDYYLSKRIRHQSFIGRLRNELEQSQLITTKVSENGSYQDNQFWIDYLCVEHHELKDKLQKVFKNFSASFDKNLLDLKENKLHIKSVEKPDGMLILNTPSNYIPILRYVMKQDDMDSILTSLVDILWGSLSNSLKSTKNYINNDLSHHISLLFDNLKLNIKKQIGDQLPAINSKYLELDQKITGCNSSIQAVLIEIGNWFTRNELEAHSTYIKPDEMIDLAISTASKSLNNINIEIENTIRVIDSSDEDFRLSLSNLPVFNDIYFILLDNVQEHSLLDNPKVISNTIFDCDNNRFEIEFINECHSRSKIKNSETVNRIYAEIKSKSIVRSRQEGNSGLIKLVAAEDNSDNFSIDFGYNTDKSFRVKLVYPLIRTEFIYEKSEDIK